MFKDQIDTFNQLKINIAESKVNHLNKIANAIDHLNSAIKIFDESNLSSYAEQITDIILKYAQNEGIANQMRKMLQDEKLAVKTYLIYAHEFKDFAKEFIEHAKQESEHVHWLQSKVNCIVSEIEPTIYSDIKQVKKQLEMMEKQGIENWKKLYDIADETLKPEINKYLEQEQHHLSDVSK